MALTRSMLKGMGLTDEQVGAIIEEHTSVTEGLKQQRDKYKEDAEKLPKLQEELKTLKEDHSGDEWKDKYNAEHESFEKFKAEVADKENVSNLKKAYKKLLAECKVGDKHVDSILRVTDFSKMKLQEDGSFDGADKLKEAIQSDWGGFITKEETKGSDVETPPKTAETKTENSRAAEIAAKYHDNLYGKVKED